MEENKQQLIVEDIHKIKNEMVSLKFQMGEIHSMKSQVNEIFIAFKGSEIMKDGGLVARIMNNEKEIILCNERLKLSIERVELRLDDIEEKESKSSVYIKILWGAGGGFLVLLFSMLFKTVFK